MVFLRCVLFFFFAVFSAGGFASESYFGNGQFRAVKRTTEAKHTVEIFLKRDIDWIPVFRFNSESFIVHFKLQANYSSYFFVVETESGTQDIRFMARTFDNRYRAYRNLNNGKLQVDRFQDGRWQFLREILTDNSALDFILYYQSATYTCIIKYQNNGQYWDRGVRDNILRI